MTLRIFVSTISRARVYVSYGLKINNVTVYDDVCIIFVCKLLVGFLDDFACFLRTKVILYVVLIVYLRV